MNNWIYDIELFPNFFCSTFLNVDNESDLKTFVICHDLKIDEKDKMKDFIEKNVDMLTGYNSIFYDNPILMQILEYSGENLHGDLYGHSQQIISSDRGGGYSKIKTPFKNLDLMKMMAFDKLGVSLKQCAINLKWKKIQDLPLPYDHIVKREDVETIIRYNINDVLISFELYKSLQPEIELRREMGSTYDVDLLSASDSKMANILLEKFYTNETGIDIKDIKYLRTKRDFLWLKDCICSGIKFKTKKLRDLKFETANTLVVAENNFAYKKSLNFGNISYELGIGGLHSDDGPGLFLSDEKYIIRDLDANSYYPSIIINNKIKPDHLNEQFVNVLKKITIERLDAKKSDNKVKAKGLKITINSIFGKLGSETFWLEDAKAMLTVTVSGQLFLLMLIEALTLEGIIVISANTDGVVCKIPRKLEDKYIEICDWWQKETGFELEYVDYSMYVRSDVNNYIVKKLNGETKEKGRYLQGIDLKKGYHYPIVPKCLYEYFVNNQPVESTLENSDDILEFCISQKSGKDFSMEYRENETVQHLQKTNRFFISKGGGSIVKVNKETGTEIGLYVGKPTRILNDHDSLLPISNYDIDFSFYKEEAQKYINDIEKAVYPDTASTEELSTDKEDGIELEIDNFDTSKITIKSPKFRHSKSSYYFDKPNNIIYRGTNYIKFITGNISKDLENIADGYYPNFIDLLVEITENCHISSRQMDILIRLNYFEEFGNNKKLLDIYREFNNGANRYNKTLKQETKNKRKLLLIEYEKIVPNSKINLLEQIFFEIDLLEYVQSTFDVDKRYVFVNKLDEKYSPKITCQCLANGKTTVLKIQKKIYEGNPILGGDIVYCRNFEQKNAVSFVNNEFVEDNSKPKVWWLQNYKVLSKEEIDKLVY
jgi:hypothetical protein